MSSATGAGIAPESIDSPAALALIAELDDYLGALYPPEENFLALAAGDVRPGNGLFLVARLADEPVACGAVRLLSPTTAEIKRMYVRPVARGLGLARGLLQALEQEARALGARRAVLETGDRQPEALGLYRHSGYAPIPCFGEYAASPSSLCLEKQLQADARGRRAPR